MPSDWHNNAPIYRQLKDRIVGMLLDGLLKPGDPLPSVRALAASSLGQLASTGSASASPPALIACLEDEDESVRASAAIALGSYRRGLESIARVLLRRFPTEGDQARAAFGHAGEVG